jgi:hypothetical protein
MKIATGRLLAALTAAYAAFSATGCMVHDDSRTAGVDEFPNSIYARVNGFLDEGKKSESVGEAPAAAEGLFVQSSFNVPAGKVAAGNAAVGKIGAAESAASGPLHRLAKASAAGCAGGTFTFTQPVTDLLKKTENTIIVCVDDKFLDTTKGNETVLQAKSVSTYNSGRVETVVITDADGDGIVNAVGKDSKSNLVFTVEEKGILEKSVLVVGPGPDLDFDTEADNYVYSASWVKTSGPDTLGRASYADADGDGIAVDNGKASVVDVDVYQKGPSADHPDALWSRAQLRMVVRYHVDAKEVRRVRFEMEDTAGRQETGEILDRNGAKDFDMRDTVQAHFLSVGTAPSDSLDTMDVYLTMGLGKDFDSKLDDSVYAIDVRAVKKIGEEKSARFAFKSDGPIPSGKDPEAGALTMEVEYTYGTSLSVEGTISATRMDVTIEDREGKRLHVVWDRHGKGISSEPIH